MTLTLDRAIALLTRHEKLLNHLDAGLCPNCRADFPDLREHLNEVSILLTSHAADQAQEASED